MKLYFWNLLVPIAVIKTVFAVPNANTVSACTALQKILGSKLSLPASKQYKSENTNYWSAALRELKPACVIHPSTAEDVSTVVKTLGLPQHQLVKFVVKSGGHS